MRDAPYAFAQVQGPRQAVAQGLKGSYSLQLVRSQSCHQNPTGRLGAGSGKNDSALSSCDQFWEAGSKSAPEAIDPPPPGVVPVSPVSKSTGLVSFLLQLCLHRKLLCSHSGFI